MTCPSVKMMPVWNRSEILCLITSVYFTCRLVSRWWVQSKLHQFMLKSEIFPPSLLVTLWALTLVIQLSLGTNLWHKNCRQKGECLTQLHVILTSPWDKAVKGKDSFGDNGFEVSITRLVWLVQVLLGLLWVCRYVDEEIVPLVGYAKSQREILGQHPNIFFNDIPLMTWFPFKSSSF